ncbi:hypothetical protein BGZ61DRAFT_473586 [Ilyonectria robusta]|uniref:uncharacterized protein n=1 Tax=Ilyonectria robusta TaxID=1079257 RepID=UPI001E8E1686|nr:uncharacterized protein BGZ61DRAFT_473586 [Ilyonectria robusta]KAH8734920.1 hypothetical protein BGZ61DRAFT_473586 [Ilyonectria robusta]
MMLHGAQSPSAVSPALPAVAADAAPEAGDQQTRLQRRKRKAGTQTNERLSKRLSLLNLEQGGSKLYVPVETPASSSNNNSAPAPRAAVMPDDTMQLDDSKHKVYIYNIDDELSSDSESDDGKLVFLPDIEKHLRATRIPPSILAKPDAEVEGMEVVLYSDPKSLTVPEGKDSVRKAIIESRRRTREQQRLERESKSIDVATTAPSIDNASMPSNMTSGGYDDSDAMDMD